MGYKVYTKGFEDLEKQLEKAGTRVTPMMKRAIYASAGEVADSVRSNLNSVLSDKATGVLASGININRIGAKDGTVYTSVGFDGYDDKGTPLPLIAAVLESGRKDQPGRKKTHFFSHAVRQSRNAALAAAINEIKDYLNKELGE